MSKTGRAKRYVTHMAIIGRDPDAEDYLAGTVYERDPSPRPTGLYDAHGNKLYAVDEMEPIGFVHPIRE